MIVRYIHKKADGTITSRVVDMSTGKLVKNQRRQRSQPGEQGYWQLSMSNAVGVEQEAQARKIDAALGVPIDYVKKGDTALAAFDSRPQKQKWLRAHKRVDHDAGYGDPAPGDFGGPGAPG